MGNDFGYFNDVNDMNKKNNKNNIYKENNYINKSEQNKKNYFVKEVRFFYLNHKIILFLSNKD